MPSAPNSVAIKIVLSLRKASTTAALMSADFDPETASVPLCLSSHAR